jgi:acetyltransferase-like isoleucine patch superfamily enzyme
MTNTFEAAPADDPQAPIRARLRHCGQNTKIYPFARIAAPEMISIGNGCQIDDFTFLAGGQGIILGNRVHIASYSSIVGGGHAIMENFSGLAASCRIVTGSEEFMGEGLTNPCAPKEFRFPKTGEVVIEKHALLFTNVIVLPDVVIGEGCVIGANSIVTRSIEPWGVYMMKNGRLTRVRERPKGNILRFEQECETTYGY